MASYAFSGNQLVTAINYRYLLYIIVYQGTRYQVVLFVPSTCFLRSRTYHTMTPIILPAYWYNIYIYIYQVCIYNNIYIHIYNIYIYIYRAVLTAVAHFDLQYLIYCSCTTVLSTGRKNGLMWRTHTHCTCLCPESRLINHRLDRKAAESVERSIYKVITSVTINIL